MSLLSLILSSFSAALLSSCPGLANGFPALVRLPALASLPVLASSPVLASFPPILGAELGSQPFPNPGPLAADTVPLRSYLFYTLPVILGLAFLLDLILGDPTGWPHPVKRIGHTAQGLAKILYPPRPSFFPSPKEEKTYQRKAFWRGALMALGHPTALALAAWFLMRFLYPLQPTSVFIVRLVYAYELIAVKDMVQEALAVRNNLKFGDLPGARKALARIVGRDTEQLTDEEVIMATLETMAENFSDGVVAPLFYLCLFDIPGMIFFKTVSTYDSLFGYKNEKYMYFGRMGAKLDDILNYIPARISVFLLLLPMGFLGMRPSQAWKIMRRDAKKHVSPNAGRPEACVAGGMGLQFGGPASYGGVRTEKPTLGDPTRSPRIQDIDHLAKLYILASGLGFILAIGLAHFAFRFFLARGWISLFS